MLPSERALAERFAVSRPLVREVLRGMQERGLIEVIPGRGAFVTRPSAMAGMRPMDAIYRRRSATPRHLVSARAMLEQHAAALAAASATSDDLAAMDRALTSFDAATGLLERARSDIAFHFLVARASHNPVIETMFASIAGMVFELMLRSLDDPETVALGAPYHHKLYAAIRDRDAEAASRAAFGHLQVAQHTYGQDMEELLDTIARDRLERFFGRTVNLDEVISAAIEEFLEH
jgi:GntR family transcriptional repressor for pyruvate dehydrogenase complex